MFEKYQGKMANWWTNVQQRKAHMYTAIQNYKLAKRNFKSKRTAAEKTCVRVDYQRVVYPVDSLDLYSVRVVCCEGCKTEYNRECPGVKAKKSCDQAFGKYIETRENIKNSVLNFCKSWLGR